MTADEEAGGNTYAKRVPISSIHGIAVVDKEGGWTSHDVVAKARKILGQKKIGHSGTLDPDATGVLLLGVGKATRLLRYLTALPKSYVGEVVLGTETSTLDAAGDVVTTHDMQSVTLDQARDAAGAFVGDIQQVPPMVSAVKVGGRRLHELARAGEDVEREPRLVTVHRFDITEQVETGSDGNPVFRVEVDCSSGTYVRVLAADLGEALGGGAHLRGLRRTAIGSFTEDEAKPLDQLAVLPPAEAMRDYAAVHVDADTATLVRHGRPLDRTTLGVPPTGDGPWAVLDPDGDLLAVYEPHRGETAKPAVVVA